MYRLIPLIFCWSIPLFSICQEKPNILFIVSEDNGPEIGCYGTPIKTPHLDKLAKKGVLFENAFVAQAGCSPSRAAFLTGLYPHQNGQIGLATWKYHLFDPEVPNIPKSLKAAGYTTGIIGKLHVNPESAFPFDFSSIHESNFAREDMEQYAIDAEKFMTESNKPFYLQVNYPDAHAPFIKQVDGLPKKPVTAKEVDPLPYMKLNHPKLKEATANYYNCMMRLDTYIGDLIKASKKSGKFKNTLIIYIGDHGADLLRGKRTSYEGGLRIPMIVSWPGKGLTKTRLNELVNTIDLYPTFLEAAGLSVPAYLPGKSMMPLLTGEEREWRTLLFTEYHVHSNHNPYPQRTVRNDRYKLIYNPLSGTVNPGYAFTLNKTVKISEEELLKDADIQVRKAYQLMKNPPEYELYDLETDPYEMKNLSHDQANAEVLEQLKTALLQWQKQTADPLIDKAKARQLFEMIQKTGIDKQPREVVPYANLLNSKKESVLELYEPHIYNDMPYRLMKPIDLDPENSYPVIVSLHGGGGRGNDNLKQLRDWNHTLAQPQIRTTYPSYIIAPQTTVMWNTTHLQNIKDIIKDLSSVDLDRIYILGHSMGGEGTYRMIQSDADYFAAAAPSAGSGRGGRPDFVEASKIKDIPIWAFHGDQDKVCPIERNQKIFAEMQKIGGNMKFTTWTGDGHGVAVKMITGSDNGLAKVSSDRCDPEAIFLKWLFKQKLSN